MLFAACSAETDEDEFSVLPVFEVFVPDVFIDTSSEGPDLIFDDGPCDGYRRALPVMTVISVRSMTCARVGFASRVRWLIVLARDPCQRPSVA